MSISQSYYTSCRVGIKGSQGFQMNAATPTLPADVLASLERLGGYAAPRSAPTRPTEEQIDSFPISLVFARLANGDAAIGQSKYIGKDYSGRFGNYFAHFLVIPSGEIEALEFTPIALWRSPLWTTTESATTELPAIEKVPESYELDSSGLDKKPEMRHRLGQMISAVERALDGGPRLIIAHSDGLVAAWIALSTQVLPAHLAWLVTFTTYAKSPTFANAMIAGTTLDSDFGFSDFEIQHQYAVFDFVKNRFSPVEVTPFARMVVAAFALAGKCDPGLFPEFVKRVAPDLTLKDLAVAFGCFGLVHRQRFEVAAAAICDWCRLHVARLRPNEIRAIVAGLEDEAAASMEGLRAVESLVVAAVQAGRAQEVIPAFAGILLRVLPSAEVSWLQRMPALLQEGRAREFAGEWKAPLAQFSELARLSVVLAIRDAWGPRETEDAALRHAGRLVLGSRLQEPAAQQALLDLVEGGLAEDVMEGVAEALQERALDRGFLLQLGEVLLSGKAGLLLEAIARRRRFAELAAYLAAHRMRRKQVAPEKMFRELRTLLEELEGSFDAAVLDMIFELAWQGQRLDHRACAGLFSAFATEPARSVFAGSKVPGCIADSVVERHASLRESDLEQVGVLLHKEFRKGLGNKSAYLHALVILSHKVDAKGVKLCWILAPKVEGAVQERLLLAATRALFEIATPKKHQDLLCRGLEVFPGKVATLYAQTLRERVERENDTGEFIRLARIWLHLLDEKEIPDASEQKQDNPITLAIADVYRAFPRQERGAIDGKLKEDARLAPLWVEVSGGGSFFGKAMSWMRGKP